MTHPDPVLVSFDEAVAHIRFNRPEALNAVDVSMAEAFRDAVSSAVGRDGVRVILLSGEGRAFMAGGDLASLRAAREGAPEVARAIIAPMNQALQALAEGPAAVVARLHGAVAGAGMSLALAADFAVAAEDVRFNLAYIKVATTPDCGGSLRLVRLVGLRRAMEIALLAETIDARRALDLGLVNRVVAPGDLSRETDELCRRLCAAPPRAVAETRRLLQQAPGAALAGQLQAELEAFQRCAGTDDFHEALNAFFDKRPPSFRGR